MFGLFKKTPKLEATFTASHAVAKELAKEVAITGELVIRNVGKDAELSGLELLMVAGGTRRIDLPLPKELAGTVRVAGGSTMNVPCTWQVKLAAPWRAPHAEIQLQSNAGGKITPLFLTNKFDIANE